MALMIWDGTVRHELIYHDAGATTPEFLSVERIQELIREAGREPIERDTPLSRSRSHRRQLDELVNWRTGCYFGVKVKY